MYSVEDFIAQARSLGASDVHLICGVPPKVRMDGQLDNMIQNVLTEEDCIDISKQLVGNRFDRLMEEGELDASATIADVRCRLHLFKQQGIPSIAIRLLQEKIPVMENLGLPKAALELPKLHKGIVLVTGETGSGKSTTLASMLDYVNHHEKCHIVTLEDPIEYVYKPDLAAINQREIGKDTKSFSEGLRASLREDPNVILIGEMRDKDTIETAITAAETGHLVFGTLHTGSAADSIDRMVQVFPDGMHPQIRMQLSVTLQAVLTQQLLPKTGGGRVLACEMMIVSDAIRNLIRTGNTPQISNAVATSVADGGQTMDQALVQLVRTNKISRDIAMSYAHDRLYMKKNVL